MMLDLDSASWETILDELRSGTIPPGQIHTAIVRLGKPLDRRKIEKAKDAVSAYLEHPNPWIRHEALWFLGSWGRLREYEPQIIKALRFDPDEDNRSFAAFCLGTLEAGRNDPKVLRALKDVVLEPNEAEIVRVNSFAAMLEVAGRKIDRSEFFALQTGARGLSDIDWQWVNKIP
jgi:HEAT repeats